jgi:putative peptidoglycan lipid II flippase
MLPRVFSSAIYQLNNFVDSIFGSLAFIVGEGGVAGLYFAYRLIQFPLGIFSNALSQAILPTFSTQALEDNRDKLKQTLSFGLRAVFFVMLPATAGFIFLAKPIVSTLFAGGKFDAYSTELTAKVLLFYSIGLSAYGATKVMQSCFFALKDTLTPTKVSGLALVLNIILNFILMFPMKLSGLALATSLSGISTFSILFFILKKRLRPFEIKPILSSFMRILAASLGMGILSHFIYRKNIFLGDGILGKALNLGAAIFSGVIFYILFCFIFKVTEMQELRRWLAQRKKG